MKAGRELDVLVAEKVMGWTYKTFPEGACPHIKHWYSGEQYMLMKPFSSDISAAWQVVEKLKERTNLFPQVGWVRVHDNTYQHRCEIWMNDPSAHKHGWLADEYADTAPLAICLATLKAVGVEVPND